MADPFAALSDVGGAVSDLFGMFGSQQAASAYDKAADVAEGNKAVTLRSGEIQQQQENQTIVQSLGTTNAGVAGAGFTMGGSAGDLLRMSAQKGALNKQLLANQTEITAQGFEQQAQAYEGQKEAANTKAAGQGIGGALQGVMGVAELTGWVICTELVNQRRMPRKYWMPGAAIFASYPEAVREGYFTWAVPSVRHMRRNPLSLYTCFLSVVFNWRAENIAARRGIKGARKLWRGAAVTAVLWPICYAIGAVRLALNFNTNWKGLYSGR